MEHIPQAGAGGGGVQEESGQPGTGLRGHAAGPLARGHSCKLRDTHIDMGHSLMAETVLPQLCQYTSNTFTKHYHIYCTCHTYLRSYYISLGITPA